jgi:hypothetical protein
MVPGAMLSRCKVLSCIPAIRLHKDKVQRYALYKDARMRCKKETFFFQKFLCNDEVQSNKLCVSVMCCRRCYDDDGGGGAQPATSPLLQSLSKRVFMTYLRM